MEMVRARDGCDVHDPAGGTTIFGSEVTRDNTELLHRVQGHALPNGCGESIDVFTTIEEYVGARGALTVYVEPDTSHCKVQRIAFRDVSRQSDEVIWIAS